MLSWFKRKRPIRSDPVGQAITGYLDSRVNSSSRVYGGVSATISIQVLAPTIEQYNEVLKTVLRRTKAGLEVNNVVDSLIPITVTMSEFHLDTSGNYIDVDIASSTFIELSVEVLELYRKCELTRVEDPSSSYLHRVLSSLVSNLILLDGVLHERRSKEKGKEVR